VRTSSATASVTSIAAPAGRLMATEDTVRARNRRALSARFFGRLRDSKAGDIAALTVDGFPDRGKRGTAGFGPTAAVLPRYHRCAGAMQP
jgi:hypothetical protein